LNDKSCQAKRLKVEQYEEYSKPEEEKVEIKDKTEDNSQESNSSSSAESSQNLEDSKTSGSSRCVVMWKVPSRHEKTYKLMNLSKKKLLLNIL